MCAHCTFVVFFLWGVLEKGKETLKFPISKLKFQMSVNKFITDA